MKKEKTKLKNPLVGEKSSEKSPKRSIFMNIFFYLFLGIILFTFFSSLNKAEYDPSKRKPISEVMGLINDGKVEKIEVDGSVIVVTPKVGEKFVTLKEDSISFDQILSNNKIDKSKIPSGIDIKQDISWMSLLTNIAQVAFPIIFILFLFKQFKGAGGDVFSFGKSRAKLFAKDSSSIKFSDVAGSDEAKGELIEIVDFLKNPAKYKALGARIPRGVLLVGAAGVGKTLLAKAVAGEANVPFFSVAGSEFMEMLVGVGSSRVRDLFEMAKASQPSLIFIDEIDAIGRQRGMGIGGGHDEREQTLNQILVEMDGFDPRSSVIVLAATNRPDMLDAALIRPGRFDRRVIISLPDIKEREEIIKIHMRGKPFHEHVDIDKIAKRTVGFSGADLENMLNEAAILAARNGKKEIDAKDLEDSTLKVQLGPEKKKMQSEEDRRIVAYHEAGHAVAAYYVGGMDPVHRISIISRGMSLGFTLFPPTMERYNETKSRLLAMITTSLGGRAAEEIVFNEQTIGASNDIEKASEIARKMVTEFGMSELGPISFESREGKSFFSWQIGEGQKYSNEVAAKIDTAIKKIIDSCYESARNILLERREKLNLVSEELVQRETLDAEEFEALMKSAI